MREVMSETCKVRVEYGRYLFHECGRLVKEDNLCGMHLAAERRRAKNREKRDAERARSDAKREQGSSAAQAVMDFTGATSGAHAHYARGFGSSAIGSYDGNLVVSRDLLRRLVETAASDPDKAADLAEKLSP